MALYKVVLHSQKHPKRTVRGLTGLSMAEAQKICRDPETSSRTAIGKEALARTRRLGCEWFYGWTEDK